MCAGEIAPPAVVLLAPLPLLPLLMLLLLLTEDDDDEDDDGKDPRERYMYDGESAPPARSACIFPLSQEMFPRKERFPQGKIFLSEIKSLQINGPGAHG